MAKGIGKEFMRQTSYEQLGESDQSKGLPQPPLVTPYEGPGPAIELPAPDNITVKSPDLTKAIESRTSVRRYTEKPLTLDDLSYLLWCTQGVKEQTPRPVTLRNVPSAGARHAFETYLLVNRVEELQPGLYRLLPLEHNLAQISTDQSLAEKVTQAALNQNIVRTSAVTFIWVADVYRMYWRYDERGYRYLHLDAGHVCQNLYLASAAVGCGTCAIGAFYDEKMNRLIGVDGEEQFVIYMATVGKKG